MDMRDYTWMKPHIMPGLWVIKDLLQRSSTYLPLADLSNENQTLHAGGVIIGTVRTYSDSLEVHFSHWFERYDTYYLMCAAGVLDMEKDLP